jgi:hypothetical protein
MHTTVTVVMEENKRGRVPTRANLAKLPQKKQICQFVYIFFLPFSLLIPFPITLKFCARLHEAQDGREGQYVCEKGLIDKWYP